MHLNWKARLIQLARRPAVGRVIGWVFAKMSFLLPVDRLVDTEELVAFWHPQPAYATHILIAPKRAYPSLTAVPAGEGAFWGALMETVQRLVRELGLEEGGYRLIANGGAFQEVGQLHFHLVSDRPSADQGRP